jgi:hypothetical protein
VALPRIASQAAEERDKMVKAVFLDRDGVLNANLERDGKPVAPTSLAELWFLPGVEETTRRLKKAGFLLGVVTNQPDVRTYGNTMVALSNPCYTRLRARDASDARWIRPVPAGRMTDYSRASGVDPSLNCTPRPVSELPERALIDFATKSNPRCPMCPVWASEENNAIASVNGVMKADAASRLLNEIAPVRPFI